MKPANSIKLAQKAFTLVEMLLVVVIIGILLTISLQLGQSWKASALSAQARQLAADFSQAALMAQKDNKPVEFRFYLLPDEMGQGSVTASRAFQIVRLTGYDSKTKLPNYEHLSEVRYFQDDIVLHESNQYSSLLKQPVIPPKPNDPEIRGEQRSYFSFMFLPNGTTSLPRGEEAVFTLVKENELKNKESLPANYRSVILQPVTSNATVF